MTSPARKSPNPAADFSLLTMNDFSNTHNVIITDVAGRLIRRYDKYVLNTLRIEKGNLEKGIYFVTVENASNANASVKLVIE